MEEQHTLIRNAPVFTSIVSIRLAPVMTKRLSPSRLNRAPIVFVIRTEKPGSRRFRRSIHTQIFGSDRKHMFIGTELEIIQHTVRKRNLVRSVTERLIQTA
jgi:hypothetical protein